MATRCKPTLDQFFVKFTQSTHLTVCNARMKRQYFSLEQTRAITKVEKCASLESICLPSPPGKLIQNYPVCAHPSHFTTRSCIVSFRLYLLRPILPLLYCFEFPLCPRLCGTLHIFTLLFFSNKGIICMLRDGKGKVEGSCFHIFPFT